MSMSKVQARKKAVDLYGPRADAVSSSSRNRDERFGIVTVVLLSPEDGYALVCLGHGDSYESAFDMASKNDVAIAEAEAFKKAKEDLKNGFGDDPKKYLEEKMEEIKKITGDQNNG